MVIDYYIFRDLHNSLLQMLTCRVKEVKFDIFENIRHEVCQSNEKFKGFKFMLFVFRADLICRPKGSKVKVDL